MRRFKVLFTSAKHQALLIYYLLFVLLATPAIAQEATEPGDTVRERVRERIEELTRKPRAFVGKIVDLPDSIIEIETANDQMRQVKTDEDTVFIGVTAGVRRTIKFSDLAVGDWVIAMGYLGDNQVLNARRVITTSTSPLTIRRAVYGIVEDEEGNVFTIKHPKTGETWTVESDSATQVTTKSDTRIVRGKLGDIEIGDRIIAAGTPAEAGNTIDARLIHIIPGLAEGLSSPSPTPTP